MPDKRDGWLARTLARIRALRFRPAVDRIFALRRAPVANADDFCPQCSDPLQSACGECGRTLVCVRAAAADEAPRALERPLASWEFGLGGVVGCSIERDPWSDDGRGCIGEALHFESGWRVLLEGPQIGDNPATRRALNRAAGFLESLHADAGGPGV